MDRDDLHVPRVDGPLTRQFDPATTVGAELVELLDELRGSTGRTPEADMGFPADWRRQEVWRS